MTTFSTIIPALNEADRIGQAIASAWAAGAAEVIVVDGGSSDETAHIAIGAGAQLLPAPCGRATQQNAGAQIATSDFLLFLHADTWLADNVEQQITTAMKDPGFVVGAFRQRIEADGWLYRSLEAGNAMRVRWRGIAYGDQGILIRRQLFEEVNGFPEVPLMEDLLLMRRIRKHRPLKILPGPLHVSARRWKKNGVVKQTLHNWSLLAAERCGVSMERLARWYRPAEHRTLNVQR